MALATASDGVKLFYEEAGSGTPIIFVHEFGGSHWSWEPQLNFFARRHRCITFAARGYPPSDVPENVESYSQARAADDIVDVLSAAGIDKAHVVGLSMGGFASLHAALRHPGRVLSVVAAGAGYGAEKLHEEYFKGISEQVARNFEQRGARDFAPTYAEGASRVQFQDKDPRGWALFAERLGQHDSMGAANTMRGVQMRRPSLYDLEAEFRAMQAPLLVMTGDEDDHCIQPGLYLKRVVPRCGLAVFPKSGHTLNLEEPELFNRLLAEFIAQVEAGRWGVRDPRANPAQIMRTD
ncbi:alpha/beta hydrolase [Bosea sp. (in: a-proteobacteria)]|jgi:pimeloyl-ACP methyl ester carboxylesterase|uniref:alpha/beta fold hydrolase n=1 Tax=Bosea sp. (in: a-proteobacteria) TaxID=1871050 RepID=UPI002DDD6347|nr:alpha/beta hydrolase [Bosea sp. (in: a-proteobacteria)]HEV2513312.1 alpha/beta hydrolase [Bosea sp. (in: a-proteobacteria)]